MTARPSVPDRDLVDVFVPVSGDQGARGRAERLARDGVVVHPTFPDVPYEQGGCWLRELPRTHARYLHGMLFLADWHRTLLAPGPDRERHVRQVADLFLTWERVVTADPPPSMAHHDETTAQRLLQLVRLLDDAADVLDGERLRRLGDLAEGTARLLVSEQFHAGLNNHGMFQDLALVRFAAASSWLADEPLRELCLDTALTRLDAYFESAFTADGVHVENSPGYHLMVARFLRDTAAATQALDPQRHRRLSRLLEGAERYAVHSILPDGRLAPLGDTKVTRVRDTTHRSTFTGAEYRYATTQGATGTEPTERSVVFAQAGYAIHRTSWRDPGAYVATFKAAYVSGYHHHADDLALTVFGAGRWLLTEAGPFGYDYADPRTTYAFSQYAHNTVVLDERSLPRADREPAGVHLRDLLDGGGPAAPDRSTAGHAGTVGGDDGAGAGRAGGVAAAYRPVERDGEVLLDVEGSNTRFERARHDRRLTVREPGGALQLSVHDRVEHADGEEHHHDVLWHIGPGVRPFLRSHGLELYVGTTKVLELTWQASAPVHASIETPWHTRPVRALRFPTFGEVEPGVVVRLRVTSRHLDLRTQIRSGEWFYRDWGIAAPGSGWATHRDLVPVTHRLEREPGARSLVVAFSAMAPDGSFTYNYKRLLDTIPAHRLYILDDFGTGGAYYWSDHRDTGIRDSVQRLLAHVVADLRLGPEQVAVMGSSKGGTAAILHGVLFGAGRVLAGAPQVRVGSFVSANRPNILELVAGGTSESDVEWLDAVVPATAAQVQPGTQVDVFIGTDDHHYTGHLPHLVSAFRAAGHDRLVVHEVPGLGHSEIGPRFRDFAGEQLRDWVAPAPAAPGASTAGVRLRLEGAVLSATCTAAQPEDLVAFHLFKDGTAIEKQPYTRGALTHAFTLRDRGTYRVRAFVKREKGDAPTAHPSDAVRHTPR